MQTNKDIVELDRRKFCAYPINAHNIYSFESKRLNRYGKIIINFQQIGGPHVLKLKALPHDADRLEVGYLVRFVDKAQPRLFPPSFPGTF